MERSTGAWFLPAARTSVKQRSKLQCDGDGDAMEMEMEKSNPNNQQKKYPLIISMAVACEGIPKIKHLNI
jgi:hypothetical protein